MIGKTLGHYQITEKLGEGGMGVVYRAEDTVLGRQVAIKVLPDEFAHDAERLARFEREAKLLASLNHPNIAAIHGLEEHEGKRFLVLELVPGQTLSERLKKDPIPLDETLDICRQIAEGLEAAHEKGIIHRDLKPANVKVTPEGKVKILDFGLAKAFCEQIATADLSHSPTITDEMTRPGVVLGTAAYMSPEQAKGKTVDKRADIWAFGCVLFECLTARRAFHGDTITETVAAILKSEPDWTLLAVDTPPFVRSLLRQCLQKDTSLRLRDIGDVRVEMREGISEPADIIPVAQRFALGWVLTIGATTLVIGLLTGPVVMKYFRPALPAPVARSVIKVEPPGHWLNGVLVTSTPGVFDFPTRTAMALSSDGRFIVYAAVKENFGGPEDKERLYMRRLDQLAAKPIAGTEGGISPFLSRDDRWVAFRADRKLKKVSVDGGVPMPLCDVGPEPSLPFGFSWGADNQIVFAPEENTGLLRVSADGGKPETLTIPDRSKGESSHRLPHCLPAGNGILFTIITSYYNVNPRVAVLEPKTRKWRVLLEDAADARYVATGHLAFLRQGMLMAVPFDLNKLEVTGPPVPAAANVTQALNVGDSKSDTAAGQFSISASGSLVYAPGGVFPDNKASLVWVDHNGQAKPIASLKAPSFAPRLSPDGQRIAHMMGEQAWVYDLNRGTDTKLTSDGGTNFVTWTPDGKRVVFDWSGSGQPNLYWKPADGSSAMERLTTGDYSQYPGSWSPDGATLAFAVEGHRETGNDILLLDLQSRRVTPFLNSRFEEGWPEFSPDGRWIAYASNESGRREVYVLPFPGPGGKTQVSNEGGTEPLWSRNGKQLFYRWRNEVSRWKKQVFVVDIQNGPGFSASKPRLLFEQLGYLTASPIRNWDISLDGQKFLMVKLEERKPQPVTELILVQNWFEELKRLCPTGKK